VKSLLIRKATNDDHNGIRELCRTFKSDDYLPEIWPVWMASKNTVNLVAQIEDVIVGCVYGEILHEHDAWAQGLRVHGQYRKKGIGSTLMGALENELLRMGARSIFANIGVFNEGSLATVFKRKWCVASHIIRRRIRPPAGFNEQLEPFFSNTLMDVVLNSPVLASLKKTAHFRRVYFSMSRQYVQQAIDKNAVRMAPDGRSFAVVDPDTDGLKQIWVVALFGQISGIQWLIESFKGDAGRLGIELTVDSTSHVEIQSLMDSLGFEAPEKDGMYVVVQKDLLSHKIGMTVGL
jgi:GNAT superfamily N-acetyltransferase